MISDAGRRGSDAVEPYLSKADHKGSPSGPLEGVKPGQPLSVAEAASEFRDSKGVELERRDNKAASDGLASKADRDASKNAQRALAILGITFPDRLSNLERQSLIAKLSSWNKVDNLAGFLGSKVLVQGKEHQISAETLFKALANFARNRGEGDDASRTTRNLEIHLHGIASRLSPKFEQEGIEVPQDLGDLTKQMNEKYDELQKSKGLSAEILSMTEGELSESHDAVKARVKLVHSLTQQAVNETLPQFVEACIARLRATDPDGITLVEQAAMRSIVPLLPLYEKDIHAHTITALKPGQGNAFLRAAKDIGGRELSTVISGLSIDRLQRHLGPVGKFLDAPQAKPGDNPKRAVEQEQERQDKAFECLITCLTKAKWDAITPAMRMLLAAGDRVVVGAVRESPKPDGKGVPAKEIATQEELRDRALVNTLFLRYLTPALIKSSNNSVHQKAINQLAVRFQKMCNQMTMNASAVPGHHRGRSVGADQADIDKATYGKSLMDFARAVRSAGDIDLSQPPAKPA